MYAALMVGLPWSVSAHAKDIWTLPEWEKREKLIGCRWLVTCTRSGAEHLAALAPEPGRVEMIYHGLDLVRFPPSPPASCERDGSDPANPVRILSVGRAVEKKGYEVLFQALAMLPATLSWRLIHIGGGPRLGRLKQMAEASGLAPHIHWMGPQTQKEVLKQYRAADLFVLAARIAGDGDRDGLPNVLMEAHSQGLACLSTRVGGIPELIIGGETGLLVEPDDAQALAGELERLIGDPKLRARLGAAGMMRVHTHFAHDVGIDRLADRFSGKADHAKDHAGEAPACALPSTLR
jgi:glycosyltransferase involved in cell wall biosynthesis